MSKNLRQKALQSLSGNWGLAIGVTLVAAIISGAAANIPLIGTILVGYPLIVGTALFFMNLSRGGADFDNLFEPFRENFIETAITIFLMQLYIMLWSLLLVIPGIIKSFSYAMTPYILADSNGSVNYNDAIDESRRMMDGHKMEFFVLNLSFIGWFLLSLLTFGIGFFWLIPYISAAQAEFYYYVADKSPQPRTLDQDGFQTTNNNQTEEDWTF